MRIVKNNKKQSKNQQSAKLSEILFLERKIQSIPQEQKVFVQKVVEKALHEFKPAFEKLANE